MICPNCESDRNVSTEREYVYHAFDNETKDLEGGRSECSFTVTFPGIIIFHHVCEYCKIAWETKCRDLNHENNKEEWKEHEKNKKEYMSYL